MHKQIEKLKRDIASDCQSRDALEIEELTARLEDLSRNLSLETNSNIDAAALLDSTMRSYWSAMILARHAIDKAESNRRRSYATVQLTDVYADRQVPRPVCY